MKKILLIALILSPLTLVKAQADFEKRLQTQLIEVENGQNIEITEGSFSTF